MRAGEKAGDIEQKVLWPRRADDARITCAVSSDSESINATGWILVGPRSSLEIEPMTELVDARLTSWYYRAYAILGRIPPKLSASN